ncbi:MAG: integrase [Armatimonadota bacterium]|nr:integrase [Armatimonadota bacterium]MDR7520301.1 integrase [Armatimonadota bacterium]MDR7550381.1 integrase [Armatimonadota bacterium]
MSPLAKREYLQTLQLRYRQAGKAGRGRLLDEACAVTGYHRKSVIRLLAHPLPPPRHRRGPTRTYDGPVHTALRSIWEAAGHPWSVRLKALLPLWLPWAVRRFHLAPSVQRRLQTISPRTIDRLLHPDRQRLRRRLYGRTKPGTLLKHRIPIKADRWDVTRPGSVETDLVAHCGDSADGEYAHSVNGTDIATGWVETRAVLGRGQRAVCAALDEMIAAMPFPVEALDADNDSAFLNHHLVTYCRTHGIAFTRSRPAKKDDNAHIEQKNWTHVRRLLGWHRYDTPEAVAALNDLYRHELRLRMNLFQPSVRLQRKVRVGSRLRRVYAPAQTPLDRLLAGGGGDPAKVAALQHLRAHLDPFALAEAIEHKLARIERLARPRPGAAAPRTVDTALRDLHRQFALIGRPGTTAAQLQQHHRSVTPAAAR